MKKTVAPFTLILVVVALALFTGCASSSSKFASDDFNMLGIVKNSPASYEKIDNATFDIHTDEITARRNVSGDNLQLLWGLITVADY